MSRAMILAVVAAWILMSTACLVTLERNKALKSQIVALEADNAQLQQRVATLAHIRVIDSTVLAGLAQAQTDINAESEHDKTKLISAVANDPSMRDWGNNPLPDVVVGMLDKPGSKPDRTGPTGQPVDR